jgi:transcriptional regulator with XRE-family HTH domain
VGTLKRQFGRRLSQLRNEKNMTQERLAEAAGVSVDLINKIERGINAPSFTTIEKLAKSLNVPVKELFNFPGLE